MEFLIAVEEGAFKNMPVLKEVSISYSPKLTFIHHGAFENCPYLRTVNLAGNGLFTVGDFGSKLPSLTMVNVEKVFFWLNQFRYSFVESYEWFLMILVDFYKI